MVKNQKDKAFCPQINAKKANVLFVRLRRTAFCIKLLLLGNIRGYSSASLSNC